MDIKFLNNFSEILYGWIVDSTDELYFPMLQNIQDGGYGMTYLLIFLLIAGIAAPLIYYFGIAKNAAEATKKNYKITWLLGYFCLIVANYVGLMAFTECASGDVLLSFDMLKITILDFIYYSLIMELVSWLVKSKSNAPNIDLITAFK